MSDTALAFLTRTLTLAGSLADGMDFPKCEAHGCGADAKYRLQTSKWSFDYCEVCLNRVIEITEERKIFLSFEAIKQKRRF